MRNKIDRKKIALADRQTRSPQSNNNSRQAVNSDLRPVSESMDSLPLPPQVEVSVTEASLPLADECPVVEPSGETPSAPSQQLTPSRHQVLITPEEAEKYGITNPDPFNRILASHYNPGNQELTALARQHNLHSRLVAECVKKIFIEDLRSNPSCKIADPSSFRRAKLDSLAIAKALSLTQAS